MKTMRTNKDVLQALCCCNIRIKRADLCGAAKGMVKKYGVGYTIVLEETLSFELMLRTLRHELCHVILGHLEDDVKSERQKEYEVSLLMGEQKWIDKRVNFPNIFYEA